VFSDLLACFCKINWHHWASFKKSSDESSKRCFSACGLLSYELLTTAAGLPTLLETDIPNFF